MSDLEDIFELQLYAAGLSADVKRECRFHAIRRWRFDFSWPARKLAVEIEGGTWVQGRHTRGQGFESDCEKYAEALLLGWRVLRVSSAMVRSGKALEYIKLMFETIKQ